VGFYQVQHTVVFSGAPQIQIAQEIRVQANAVVQMGQNLGATVGMVIFTIIITNPNLGLANGMPAAFAFVVAVSALALIIGLFLKKLEAPAENPAQA
jgi:hypothetical protein